MMFSSSFDQEIPLSKAGCPACSSCEVGTYEDSGGNPWNVYTCMQSAGAGCSMNHAGPHCLNNMEQKPHTVIREIYVVRIFSYV